MGTAISLSAKAGMPFFHLLCIVFPLRSDYLRFVHPQAAFCRQSGG